MSIFITIGHTYKIVFICGFEGKRRKGEIGRGEGEDGHNKRTFPLETSPALRGSKFMDLAVLFTSILIKDVEQLL